MGALMGGDVELDMYGGLPYNVAFSIYSPRALTRASLLTNLWSAHT